MRTSRSLDKLVRGIEAAQSLDRPAEWLAAVNQRVVRPGAIEDALSGTPIGHPVHPVLVAVPIGAWVSASVLDAVGQPEAAQTAVGFGWLAALPTAVTGASDWLSTLGAERRVGLVHAALNWTAMAAYGVSWASRRAGRHKPGAVWSLVGAGVLGAAGYLGGHLAYARGVGVDNTAFQPLPTEWTDAIAVSEVPLEGDLVCVQVAGVPILLTRQRDEIVALDDRCTHRGGPLHEGTVSAVCVTCPWHGSVFDLVDGGVRSGPATRPQPTFDTRVMGDRLQVRLAR